LTRFRSASLRFVSLLSFCRPHKRWWTRRIISCERLGARRGDPFLRWARCRGFFPKPCSNGAACTFRSTHYFFLRLSDRVGAASGTSESDSSEPSRVEMGLRAAFSEEISQFCYCDALYHSTKSATSLPTNIIQAR
jgi:hypothetical protein